jgi:bifunctional DNA-binding transcriptional regulator/antitoxin component of YhaV-PrlF toxin-antitoxin module
MTTTLADGNQITIPADFASKLALEPGSRIEWIPGDTPNEFRCRILRDPAKLARDLLGAGRKYLRPGRKHPLTQLVEERCAEDRSCVKSPDARHENQSSGRRIHSAALRQPLSG